METIKLKVFSPQGLLFERAIDQLETTTSQGRIGLNVNQPKLVAYLEPNITNVTIDAKVHEYVIVDGILILDQKTMTIFTDDFSLKSEIDLEALNFQITQLKTYLSQLTDQMQITTITQLLTKYELKLSLVIA